MSTCLRTIGYFRDDRRLIFALVVLVGISFLVTLVQAWPIPVLADAVFNPAEKTDWIHRFFLGIFPASAAGRIATVAVLTMLLKVAQDATWFLGRVMLNNRIKYNGLARVRADLYRKLQSLPLQFHRSRNQGDMIYRLSTDTQGFFNVLDTLIGASIACVSLPILTVVMLSRSVPLTLLALSVVPPLVLVNLYFAKAIKRSADEAKLREADYTTAVQRSMGAISLIQSFSRQAWDFGRFKKSVDDANDANWRLDWRQQLYPMAVQTIFAFGGALIFGVGGWLAYRDQFVAHATDGLSFGDLLAFMYYVTQLSDPLGRITGFKAAIQSNLAAADRVFVILDTPNPIPENADAKPLLAKSRTLSLQNVSFAYGAEGQTPTLAGISATITPGQFAAFVGPSGAGKSTLFSLLPRFYDPTEGAVRLDGHDLRDLRLEDLRAHVALVQQDSPLFPGTIAENIAFGHPGATDEEIIAAAKAAGAHEFIAKLPENYHTEIVEAAANISGGQRQRLALARALLANAPILLLDEPTSAQDPHHAAAILETLENLRGSKTILLVTHDLSLVRDADHIYVLQSGRLAESGTHVQLMAREGVYWKMRAGEAVAGASLQMAS